MEVSGRTLLAHVSRTACPRAVQRPLPRSPGSLSPLRLPTFSLAASALCRGRWRLPSFRAAASPPRLCTISSLDAHASGQLSVRSTSGSLWQMGLSKGDFGLNDVGEDAFNAMLAASPHRIVKRICNDCRESHREIYYRRITEMPAGFSAYDTLKNNWFKRNNLLHRDFELYSTYDDAVLDPPPTFSGVGIAVGASYRLRCASRDSLPRNLRSFLPAP